MPWGSLSFLLKRSTSAIKNRAHQLRLKRDPEVSGVARSAAGRAGYEAAKRRNAGIVQPVAADIGPSAVAYRKSRLRAAAEALVAHGVKEQSAALAVSLIARGAVPGARFEI